MQLGNGRWESTTFNSRLQPTQIALGTVKDATDHLKLNFTYNTAGQNDNNGNVLSQTITVPTETINNQSFAGFTAVQTYTYDSLNRIKDAKEMIGQTQQWKQAFEYDRYGNRRFDTNNNNTTTIAPGCPTEVCNPQVDPATNKLIGYQFDASGNTKVDAENRTFIYDGENKQVEVKDSNGATVGKYFYNGDGQRIKKLSATEATVFIYNAGGQLVAEYATQITQPADAKVSYLTTDHLGSQRITTDANGQVTSRRDFQPFGEEIARAGYGTDNVRQKFTTYERDAETELDFAQNRYYAWRLGRFTTPDELFADQCEHNPQSWSLYSYVRNNPLNLTDRFRRSAACPQGRECEFDSEGREFYVDGNELIYTEDDPIKIETTAPRCSLNNPCVTDLPDSLHDWVQGWGSFRRMIWNMRCREVGGCNIEKALYHFGTTALAFSPVGVALRGLRAAKTVPSILKTLCFVGGTLVLTNRGLRPIEEIREGDQVLSFNEDTKQTEFKIVVRTMVREAEAGRILSLRVEGEVEPLGVTGEHPFYVRVHGARSNLSGESDDGHWVEAGALQVGDEILKADGYWARVESVSQRIEGARVYNFEVADNHNYFVGQSGLLVHNNYVVELTKKGKSKIGNLIEHAQSKARDVLNLSGGNASATRVGDVPNEYWDKLLAEIANLAANKDAAAETVMKLVEQAGSKAQKY